MSAWDEDVVGVRWVNENKAWIPNPVAEWILETYPDLLPNHGWFTWADVSGDRRVCVCKRPLPDRDERHPSLLIHVAEQVARLLVAEELEAEAVERGWSTIRSGTRVTWVDENGVQHTIEDALVSYRRIDE